MTWQYGSDVPVRRTRGIQILHLLGSYRGISWWHVSPLTRWHVAVMTSPPHRSAIRDHTQQNSFFYRSSFPSRDCDMQELLGRDILYTEVIGMSGLSFLKASHSFNTLSHRSVITSVRGKSIKVKWYQVLGCRIPSNKGKRSLGREPEGLSAWGLSPWS